MKIFINQDSKKFVSSQKFNAVVNRFDFKRGDTAIYQQPTYFGLRGFRFSSRDHQSRNVGVLAIIAGFELYTY